MRLPHLNAKDQLQALSSEQRLPLIHTLNELPLSQLLEIEFALNIPDGIMPSVQTEQGLRTNALLQWIDGSTGLGLASLLNILFKRGIEVVNSPASTTNNASSGIQTLTVKLENSFAEFNKDQIKQLLAEFQAKADNASVEIRHIRPRSLDVELQGSIEALRRIKALFGDNAKNQIAGLNVESTSSLESIKSTKRLNLRHANLSYAKLSYANLSHSDLSYADLSYADLSYADLSYSNLSYANLIRSNLSYANLRGVNLIKAELRRAYLIRTELKGAYLRSANLGGADLRSANLGGAYLIDADLRGAYLSYAYLRGAYLRGADLKSADLRGADLIDADLRAADFVKADLVKADLSSANISSANLSSANLNRTNMTNCFGLSSSDIHAYEARGAIFNDAPGDESSISSQPEVSP